MKSNNSLLGVLGGIAAGALLGILYAPDKGSQTRKKIRKKTAKVKSDVQYELESILQNATDKYEDLKIKGEELVQQGKEELIKASKKQLNNINKN